MLRTKKLRIAKIHYHKKIQVKNFKNEGDIKDLVILLVTKIFFILIFIFGMVSRCSIPNLSVIGITVSEIYTHKSPEGARHIPFSREPKHLNPGIPGISREKFLIENNAILRTFPPKLMYFYVDELLLKL